MRLTFQTPPVFYVRLDASVCLHQHQRTRGAPFRLGTVCKVTIHQQTRKLKSLTFVFLRITDMMKCWHGPHFNMLSLSQEVILYVLNRRMLSNKRCFALPSAGGCCKRVSSFYINESVCTLCGRQYYPAAYI